MSCAQAEYLHRANIEQAMASMPQLTFKLYTGQADCAPGRLTVADIPPGVLSQAEIYLCRPSAIMQAQKQRLVESGVAVANIHREVFGPDLLEALV